MSYGHNNGARYYQEGEMAGMNGYLQTAKKRGAYGEGF
jgi:hypothetical protein